MRQIGLFDTGHFQSGSSLHQKKQNISFYPDYNSWLAEAENCLEKGVSASDIWWTEDRKTPRKNHRRCTPGNPEFEREARAASCHSSEDRWALLYSIFWRMHQGEPQLLELGGDPEVARLRKYAKAVARDVHKMKAFVRFRKIEGQPPRFVSWFEPQHLIVEFAAPFFKRRFSNMHWSILTPVGCAHWEGGGELWFSDAVDKQMAPSGDQFEDAWRVYYKSIFNPARLKINAMQSEMPKKYWKNLPEAREIRSLINSAESRTVNMISQRKENDLLRCGARPAHPNQLIEKQILESSALQSLKLQASLCSDCPQADAATQTVFGAGPENARIMIIGEQPGDQEDLSGQPFTGPAGQILTKALQRAGIEREQCYLTNAVKHFGFVPRGKRRIHKRPHPSVVAACGKWLGKEIEYVDPAIIVYLGVTAASTHFGRQVRIQRDRGRLISVGSRQHLITTHPASILRMERSAQRDAYAQFVRDLMLCAKPL